MNRGGKANYRDSFLQVLFPLVACGISLVLLAIQLVYRTTSSKRKQLNSKLLVHEIDNGAAGYHAVAEGSEDEDTLEEDFGPQKIERSEEDYEIEINRPRWAAQISLVEALLLLGVVVVNLLELVDNTWGRHGRIAAIVGLSSWTYITALTGLRVLFTLTRGNRLPGLWYHTAILYIVQWVISALLFRSAIVHPRSDTARTLMSVDFALSTALAFIALVARRGNRTVILEHENKLQPSREPLASFISIATFSWVDKIVWEGYKKPFELDDIWNLVPQDKPAAVLADYRKLKQTTRLSIHLLRYFKTMLFIQGCWAMLAGFLTFMPTLLLRQILQYVEDPESRPANAAWFFVVLLAVTGCVTGVADGQALWTGRKICIRLRAILIGEIYSKALRRKAAAASSTVLGEDKDKQGKLKSWITWLNPFARKKKAKAEGNVAAKLDAKGDDSQVNVGTIINLMAIDTSRVSEVSAYMHFLFPTAPVQVAVAIGLLYNILGWSSIAGVGIMIVVMPLNLYIANQFTATQKKIMAATDVRIHSTNEVLQNIRIIKYFAWEQRFEQQINEKRRVELRALRNRFILWTMASIVWYAVPMLITALSFFLFTAVEKKNLIPSIAFTALSLFQLLRYPLDQIADMVARVLECKVSIDRIEEFLNEEETEKFKQLSKTPEYQDGEMMVGFRHATLTWGAKNPQDDQTAKAFRLINMDVRFKVGCLNIVAGPTGSGKTSLLLALLGEMTLVEGKVYFPGGYSREDLRPDPETGLTESVAYCAQQAWLVNDTIKNNIVFASPWDESRYESVIEACALKRDLEIFEAGDSTLVGEKGIVVSGGQKQRISLARAMYCNARHILLDDCLSAVDSHTAQHIFKHGIQSPLMYNRTCILVTHNISLCIPQSQFVVVLANGKIAAQGPPDVVMSSGALGDEMLKSKPSSKSGTGAPSRSDSHNDLEAQVAQQNGKPNGDVDDDAPEKAKSKEPVDTRTETKAEGSVKWSVISYYMFSMGPWYFWVFVMIAYAAEQVASVSTNLWIRQWANSYHTEELNTLAASNQSPPIFPSGNFGANIRPTTNPFWISPRIFGMQLTPFGSSKVVRATLDSPSQSNVSYYLGIYVLLGAIYLFCVVGRYGVIFDGSLGASRKIHAQLLRMVTRAKFKFFDTTPLGQITNRFSKDLETIDQELAAIATGVLQCIFSVIAIIATISVITPGFLVAAFFLTLIYFAIGFFYIQSSRDLKRIESVQRSPLYQQFGETLNGITTIRAYADERRFIRDNSDRVSTYNRPFIYLWSTNRWLALRVDFAGALVSFFAALFVIRSVGTLDAGAAGVSMTYAVMFNENVLWLVRLYAMSEQNMNSVERIKEYMDVEQEGKPTLPENSPPSDWPSAGSIKFVNYTTRYRPELDPVLKNLSFSIKPKEKVGIVGRTGAGKSSLALALFRGLEADDGQIFIDDVDIGLIDLQDLRESITIVPQDPTLFTGTIRSNLDPFDLFTDEEIFEALRGVHLIGDSASVSSSVPPPSSDLNALLVPPKPTSQPDEDPDGKNDLTKVITNTRENANVFSDLSSKVTESGGNLSQGQRQLLCLARALLKSPRVLLMDEVRTRMLSIGLVI